MKPHTPGPGHRLPVRHAVHQDAETVSRGTREGLGAYQARVAHHHYASEARARAMPWLRTHCAIILFLLCTARSAPAVWQRAPARRVQVQAEHLAEVAARATAHGIAVDVAITIARGWQRAA